MNNERLAQSVKELRKRKSFSQEELAKKSGLSLRTIQRLENGETEPTGETIKRISITLDLTPNELIDWGKKKEILKKTIKTKYEYLHIFENKLVISKTQKINDLVQDYGNSVNNLFKSLMVFIISIPIFTTLAVVMYNIGRTGLSIYASSFALMFLVNAFYTILFTSGSSLIKMENISKIEIKKTLHNTAVVILHRESGRLKDRSLLLEKDQIEIMIDSLLSEKLIENDNIKNKISLFNFQNFILSLFMFTLFYILTFKKVHQMGFYYGAIISIGTISLIMKMIVRSRIKLDSKKNTNTV